MLLVKIKKIHLEQLITPHLEVELMCSVRTYCGSQDDRQNYDLYVFTNGMVNYQMHRSIKMASLQPAESLPFHF